MNKKLLRIGIITFDFDPPIGGQGTYVKTLTNFLDKNKVNYFVFSTANNTSKNHIKLPRFGNRNFGPIIFSIFVNILINKWIDKFNLDIVHLQGGAGGVFLIRKVKKPVITTSHMLYSKKLEIHPS